MKKIVMGLAALAMAASIFAVDFSATVKMNTTIAAKNGDAVDFLKVNQENQKDSDALIISGTSDNVGGQFQLWYTYDGTNGENSYKDVTKAEAGTSAGPWEDKNVIAFHGLRIRNVNVWFTPIDQLKVTVGNVAIDSYKEQIFWWHGVYGAAPGSWGAFGGEYQGTQAGVKAEFRADALTFEAALFQGINTAMFSTADGYGYKGYAVKAKYAFESGSAALVFSDKGKGEDKVIAVGADFSGISGLYFFANFNARLNDGLQGISLDNYFKYSADALTIQGHLPFVMFKDGDKMVPGMYATLKVIYALDGFSPYFLATTEPDGDKGWRFDNFEFDMTFKPGVTFNVGKVGFDCAFRLDVDTDKANDKTNVNWSVPLTFSLGL